MCEGIKRSDRSAELALAFISPSEIRVDGHAPSSGFNAHAAEAMISTRSRAVFNSQSRLIQCARG
jgi:hypothetical protein